MAHHNIATSGSNQRNFGVEVALSKNVHYHLSANSTTAITVAAAQQFGSPLNTKYSYQPLQDIIRAANGADITSRRFHGQNIYHHEIGRVMTMQGHIEEMAMGSFTKPFEENPTQLSTIIVCLSVYLGKTGLGVVVASAMMLFIHGSMEKSMEGDIRIFQGKIEKYANAVLSRDAMCNKLENAKNRILELISQKAPLIQQHTLFLPPRSSTEEGDFVEFLAELWSAEADDKKIFTRSVKLLALALLISEYGWQIDVYMECDDGETISIKSDTGALSVIYSSASTAADGRTYIENHNRYIKTSWRPRYYPTATCTVANMGQVSGLSISKTQEDQLSFMRGYEYIELFCEKYFKFDLTINSSHSDGQIMVGIQAKEVEPSISPYARSCQDVVRRFVSPRTPDSVLNLIANALCELYPGYDWNPLNDRIKKQKNPDSSFTYMLHYFEGNCENLWAVAGVVLGILDKIVMSLVNIPTNSLVRTPAGESISSFVSRCSSDLVSLLGTGMEPESAIQLCATRLAGVDAHEMSTRDIGETRAIIGYWNSQQGLLLTPIFERTLYCDLELAKSRPLTLFNIPIMGMPADDAGWIRSGAVDSAIVRKKPIGSGQPIPCQVIMEYRPYFERDSKRVVASVYLDGVFYYVLDLKRTLSSRWYNVSRCQHSNAIDRTQGNFKYMTIKSFEPGELAVPARGEVGVISLQGNTVSRFFTSIAYDSFTPVIQDGCLNCALKLASETKTSVIVHRLKASYD